jgi:hypothetical protein
MSYINDPSDRVVLSMRQQQQQQQQRQQQQQQQQAEHGQIRQAQRNADARVRAAAQLRRDLHRVAMQTVRQVRPHAYWPSAIHMGDCQVCGHVQSDAIHQAERVRSTPVDPAG